MSVTDEVTKATAAQSGPLVALALELARRIDDPDEASPAAVSKELRVTLAELAAVKPAEEVDLVDALAAKRSHRRSAAAGS